MPALILLYIFFFFQLSEMRRTTSLGMGYRFSETKRRISSANDSNIVKRLASKSITGHELPIQVHQHYGLELHLILHPIEACVRRWFTDYSKAQNVCLQLKKVHFKGFVRVYMTRDVSCLCQSRNVF